MKTFFISILIGVLKDESVQQFLIKAAKVIVGDAITGKIIEALPAMFAAMLDTAIKQIPGIENLKDVGAVAQQGREILNRIIPDLDTGFKPLDDFMDMWRPKDNG